MLLLTFASALGLGKAGIQQSGELSRLQLYVRVSWIKKILPHRLVSSLQSPYFLHGLVQMYGLEFLKLMQK